MPKKTKKAKRIADSRHVTQLATSADIATTEGQKSAQFQYKFASTTKQQTALLEDSNELSAIRFDLLKTLMLAAIAISIEVILYWKLRT